MSRVQYVMPITFKAGGTVCTPDGFALKERIKRLKRELKANQLRGFRKW